MHRQKLALAVLLSASLIHAQVFQGVKMRGLGVSNAPPAPGAGFTFAPVAGHITPQSVGVTYTPSAGIGLFYSLDGSTPTSASPLYTSPLSITASTTINVLAEGVGTIGQDIGATSVKWKCVIAGTVSVTYGGLTCESGGGVGSNVASIFIWSWNGPGTAMQERISTTAANGKETQILYVYTSTGCDNCTTQVQDKWIQAVGDNTVIANNELDMWMIDGTRNSFTMFGLQCNQQASNGHHWQLDTNVGWVNSVVTIACPISTTNWTHVIEEGHRILNDTACGGSPCTYFDALTLSTCNVAPVAPGVCPAGHVVIAPTRTVLNVALKSYTTAWGSACGNQDQIDLYDTVGRANPLTGGRNVMFDNVTCGFGANATGAAAYTIP